jgi:hypothetical protein
MVEEIMDKPLKTQPSHPEVKDLQRREQEEDMHRAGFKFCSFPELGLGKLTNLSTSPVKQHCLSLYLRT